MGGTASKKIVYSGLPQLNGKTVVVTGGNTGIGYASIEAFANQGASKIVIAGRSESKVNDAFVALKAKYPAVEFIPQIVDISSFKSIEAFSTSMESAVAHIDILIDNAGIFLPPHSKTEHGFEVTIGTNGIGTAYLTSKLLPLLMKSESPRIVILSSGVVDFLNTTKFETYMADFTGASLTNSNMDVYGFSKVINTMYAFELQKKLAVIKPEAIVVSVNPGAVMTDIQNKTDKDTFLARFLHSLYPWIAKSPADGALPVVYCAISKDLEDPAVKGLMFDEGPNVKMKTFLPYMTPENCAKVYSEIEKAIKGAGGTVDLM